MNNLTCDPAVLAKKIEALEDVAQRKNRMMLDNMEVLENRIKDLERQDRIGTIGNFCTFLTALTALWLS